MHNIERSTLEQYGWNDQIKTHMEQIRAQFSEGELLVPGRIIAHTRGKVLARTGSGELWCTVSGRLARSMSDDGFNYCAGDWVALEPYPDGCGASIKAILPRFSLLERHAAGRESKSQALASNIDYVCLVMGLDRNFSPARMERLITIAYDSGAVPVVILNKADLVENPGEYAERIDAVAPGTSIHTVSAETGTGIDEIRSFLTPGSTAVLVGSSGVGKSTILNTVAREKLREVREVRSSDDRGRHTTSLRELFLLPSGGCLIDTPGLREVGLWNESDGLNDAFAEVTALADKCKFNDCAHHSEPGCAVKNALETGNLSPERYQSYLKLKREIEYVKSRENDRIRREREKRYKEIGKLQRKYKKGR